MGEDTYIYSGSHSTSYSQSYPVKVEDREEPAEIMVPYHLGNSDPYCTDQKMMMGNVGDKSFHEDLLEDYNDSRPQLHHMPNISTACTSEDYHSSLPSGGSGEVSAYDLSATETPDFEWSMQSTNPFQWPPNHNLATPPLESPIGFHQLQAYPGNATHAERHPAFPAPIHTPTDFYHPLPASRGPVQPVLQFQSFNDTTNAPHLMDSQSSGENSQSTTPRIQSPALLNGPRPNKTGSVSTIIPNGRNRRKSLASDVNVDTVAAPTTAREAMRRRSTLSSSQHHISGSPNRSHQRRSSAMSTVSASFAHPISEDVFDDKSQQSARMQIKRSKSANMIHVNHDSEFAAHADLFVPPDGSAIIENESSGDDAVTIQPDELAKTKAARAQSEHRRRVELKESFERLRLTLGVPQPRAGKRDLVEQAIIALDFYKRKQAEMLSEIQYLQQGGAAKRWSSEEMMPPNDEMQL